MQSYVSSEELMNKEHEFAAHNYHPLPVVFAKAKGVDVWDPEGKHYYDFLSAYSAVNQGHLHPKIVEAMRAQLNLATVSSRAFYNDKFPLFAEYLTKLFGYDMVLPMNTGAEAVETAIKLARKWGYTKKGIPKDQAIIISVTGCFHGRTMAVISMSSDPDCRSQFGPFCPGFSRIPWNDVGALKSFLEINGKNVAGFIVEPIQGEAGVMIPDDNYLPDCFKLCKEHNVLFIADEIQSGLGRAGRLLSCELWGVRPDIVILGKAIAGGLLPLSAVLTDKDIMLCILPGEHGSTYGGNPLASAVGIASLNVIMEEKLCENSERQGKKLLEALLAAQPEYVKTIRGRGLMIAVEFDSNFPIKAFQACLLLAHRGLLAKPTHSNIIRLLPPLVITDEQLADCINILYGAFKDLPTASYEDLPFYDPQQEETAEDEP